MADLDHQILRFSFLKYFQGRVGRLARKIPLPSYSLWRLNSDLVRTVRYLRPDAVLIWRGTHVLPRTIRSINDEKVLTVSYNNDDPFGPSVHRKAPWHHHLLWYWYLRTLRHFQKNLFYRQINVTEARRWGASDGNILKPYFIPWRDRPIRLSADDSKKFKCDVVFVGHYEPDDRVSHLKRLVDSGLSIRLFGGNWTKDVLEELHCYFGSVSPAADVQYSKAICGASVCLAFLSKLNRDTYTRRCFEIPAHGRVLLAERTDDLLQMFTEDKEACFFSSSDELVEKARWLVNNPTMAEKIALAGQQRVWSDGHDVRSRAREFVRILTDQDQHKPTKASKERSIL